MKVMNEKISNRQLWFILFMMRSTVILAYLPVLTTADALQDAWISAILTLVGSEVFVILFALLDTRFPRLSLIEYSQQLLGSWPGKLLGLVFLWLFLQLSVVNIRIYGEVLVTNFLPKTPIAFIIGSMVLASAICIYQGIEILGRAADLIFFLLSVMILAEIIIPIPEIDIHNLQPVLARGWQPILRGALTPVALILQIWTLGMLSPRTLAPEEILQIAFSSTGVSLIILVIATFITICVLGPDEGARSTFPLLSLMRSVELSEFLQRMEVLVIFSWGFGLFISISAFLYSGARGLSQWLGLKDYRPLIWPMSVIWVFLSLHGFADIFALYDFLSPETFALYGFTFLLVPLVLLWSAYGIRAIRNKKNN